MDERRQVLVNRMAHLRCEIARYFLEYMYSDEQDHPDPDGTLRRCLRGLEDSLAHEASLGHYPVPPPLTTPPPKIIRKGG